MSGELTVSTQNEKLFVFAKYLYDALGQKIRLMELVTYDNKTFTFDGLLLFREGIMYEIHYDNKTCKKLPLKADFHPMAIPKDASLLGQAILGSSSGPGQGLLVNTWTGELPENGEKYMSTFTEFGCIPVSSVVHTKDYGWMVSSLFNNIIGITNPNLLYPPSFCMDKELDIEEEPVDFHSFFQKMR